MHIWLVYSWQYPCGDMQKKLKKKAEKTSNKASQRRKSRQSLGKGGIDSPCPLACTSSTRPRPHKCWLALLWRDTCTELIFCWSGFMFLSWFLRYVSRLVHFVHNSFDEIIVVPQQTFCFLPFSKEKRYFGKETFWINCFFSVLLKAP